MSEERFEFKVGDKVRHILLDEVFIVSSGEDLRGLDFPLALYRGGVRYVQSLKVDGRISDDHKNPIIELVERPKKKVKKEVTVYVSDNCFRLLKSGDFYFENMRIDNNGFYKNKATLTIEVEE